MTNSNTLTIKGLHCTRGEQTLFKNLDIEVSSGLCLHIIGRNGSGKSSLLRILSGLNMPDDGNVMWNQTSIQGNESYLNESAFIGHKDALKNELSAIENLRFYQQLNVKKANNDESFLDDCLSQMQILHCADLLVHQLSFGQRRRLTFSKLLLRPYKIWILDEPFSGIDKNGRDIIEKTCLRHLKSGGIIILTHHQSLNNSTINEFLIEFDLDRLGKPNE